MSPRTEEQFENMREKSKEKIYLAALELISINGFANTSISQIAARAGISKGLLYNYYKSKDDLLEEIVHSSLSTMQNLFIEVNKENDPAKQLEMAIRMNFNHLKANKNFTKLFLSLITQPGISESVVVKIKMYWGFMVDNAKRIFKSLGVKDHELLAYRYGAMMDGIIFHYIYFFDEKYPINKIVESAIEEFCNPSNLKKYSATSKKNKK